MVEILEWVAPIATMIAAMLTAANLGARATGYGFAIFAVGSVCWSIIGLTSGQTNLVVTNGFLALVNAVGVRRWLGRQAKYEQGGQAAAQASAESDSPTLLTATSLAGLKVIDRDGAIVGATVEALLECSTGRISYVAVRSAGEIGVNEHLRAVSRSRIEFSTDQARLNMTSLEFNALAVLPDRVWPARIQP